MKEIRVKNAIAMCLIITSYKEFIQEAKKIINESPTFSPSYFIEDVEKVAKEKFVFGKKKAKQFYKKYQAEIEIINRHTNIKTFLFEQLYGRVEKGDLEETLESFYEYIYKNRINLDRILMVLDTMKSLGFRYVELDETADFTKEEYSISPDLMENYGRKMAYFENLERIPAYGERKIKYKTNGSHYKIKFDYSVINYRYSKDTTIYVNSLLFTPFLLPAYPCTPEDLFKEIVSLKEEKQEEVKRITKDVDDSLQLMKLRKTLEEAKKTLNTSNEVKDALLHMELELLRAEQIYDEERKKGLERDPSVTEEMLKRELTIRKKILNEPDID